MKKFVTLSVSGMTCAGCATGVEEALQTKATELAGYPAAVKNER